MSKKKTFSPEKWEHAPSNRPSNLKEKKLMATPSIYNKDANDVHADIEYIVQEAVARNIDIAPGYDDYVKLGFAIASAEGEEGREHFVRLCCVHGTSQKDAIKQYQHCLKDGRGDITIGTLFYMAKEQGITLHNSKVPDGTMELLHSAGIRDGTNSSTEVPKTDANVDVSPVAEVHSSNIQNSKVPNIQMELSTGNWIKDADDLPHLPTDAYKHLPPFLQKVTDTASSDQDKDILLLGSILVLSSTLYNVRAAYDSRTVYPNLNLFVVADAGMGKGVLSLCRNLVSPIHEERIAVAKEQRQEYEHWRQEHSKDGDNPGNVEEPGWFMHIIPANSSSTAFMEILDDNKGVGLMLETEGDTLTNTLRHDYGNYSDVLRKAFHHETISYTRRKDHEYVEITCPKLSVVLSGTPEQVRALIPDTENGLMSRFIYYHLPFTKGFRDVFACHSINDTKDEMFRRFGEQYKKMRDSFFRNGEYEFVLTLSQEANFRSQFEKFTNSCVDDIENSIQGLVFRMGLIAFRIMMVLTSIRIMDECHYSNNVNAIRRIVCSDDDYHTAMLMVDTLLKHSVYYYFQLSKTIASGSGSIAERKQKLLCALPDQFSKQEFTKTAYSLGYKKSTTDKWIDPFIAKGLIERDDHGNYHKVKPTGDSDAGVK